MQPSALKKVVLQCRGQSRGGEINLERGLQGFLAPAELEAGPLHLLTPSGQEAEIARADLLAVYFVHAFAGQGLPSLRGARAGARLPGLWVRVRGKGARWEGILASDLLDLERGIWLTPLRGGSNCQRVFIPRAAVEKLEAVEVVRPARRRGPGAGPGDSGRRGRRRDGRKTSPQFELFDEKSEENA